MVKVADVDLYNCQISQSHSIDIGRAQKSSV